jgi:hypothetical protein
MTRPVSIMILCVSIMILCAALAAPAVAGEVATVTRATAARAAASDVSASRGTAQRDDAYAVTRAEPGWVEVQFGDVTAWLDRDDVTVRDAARRRVATETNLNVRGGPGARHRTIGTLPPDARVVVKSSRGPWRELSFEGRTGWVQGRFLRAEDEATPEEPEAAADDDAATTRMVAWDGGRRIGLIDVLSIDGEPVAADTAAAFRRMREAASRDGVTLRIVSGFRTYEEQEELYRLYRAGRGNLAARPGHSNHQDGRALDLNTSDGGVYRWLTNNARRFGFKRTVPSERWHWEYRP